MEYLQLSKPQTDLRLKTFKLLSYMLKPPAISCHPSGLLDENMRQY